MGHISALKICLFVCCFHKITLYVYVQTEYSNCVNKLEKDLVSKYQSQFEKLFKAEAPTWETHGNLMVRIWFMW